MTLAIRNNFTTLANTQKYIYCEDLFNAFNNWLDSSNKKTYANYISYLRNFANWSLSQSDKEITRRSLLDYKEYLASLNLSVGTKNQYLRVAKGFLSYLYAYNFIDNDISKGVKPFREDTSRTKKEAFTETEIKAIIENIETDTLKGKRDKALLLLLITTGIRINEARLIDISDMETRENITRIYIQGKGHNEKDTYIKLPKEVKEAIDEYLKARNAKKDEPLFISTSNRHKGRISETSYSRLIKSIFKEQGFNSSKLTAHSLRHTANTTLLNSGADIYEIQQFARHKSVNTTEKYLHSKKREDSTAENDIYNQIFNKNLLESQKELINQVKSLSSEELNTLARALKEIKGGHKWTIAKD